MKADQSDLTNADLEDAAGRIFKLECASGRGLYYQLACSEPEARELAAIGRRPPPGLRLYKYGSRSVVGAYELESGLKVCLKYYFPKRFYKHLSYGLAGSRCQRSWLAALAFAQAGIPTPVPLATIEWKRCGGVWLDQAFLATRQAQGIPLSAFAAAHRAERSRLKRIARKLRGYFSMMAGHRMVHGDLKATNILVDENDELSFIDLDAFQVVKTSSRWNGLRRRDERVFAQNWSADPGLADVFGGAFAEEAGSG